MCITLEIVQVYLSNFINLVFSKVRKIMWSKFTFPKIWSTEISANKYFAKYNFTADELLLTYFYNEIFLLQSFFVMVYFC